MTSCSEMGKTLRERERERVVYAIYAENRGSNNTKGDKHTIVGWEKGGSLDLVKKTENLFESHIDLSKKVSWENH